MKCIGSGRESCKTVRAGTLKGITDLLLLNCLSGCISPSLSKDTPLLLVLAVSLVPEIDFFKVELFEIGILLKSLVDYGGFADTFKSLVSLISSCDAQISWLFRVKSVLLEPFSEELLVSLRCNISEMLGESI